MEKSWCCCFAQNLPFFKLLFYQPSSSLLDFHILGQHFDDLKLLKVGWRGLESGLPVAGRQIENWLRALLLSSSSECQVNFFPKQVEPFFLQVTVFFASQTLISNSHTGQMRWNVDKGTNMCDWVKNLRMSFLKTHSHLHTHILRTCTQNSAL